MEVYKHLRPKTRVNPALSPSLALSCTLVGLRSSTTWLLGFVSHTRSASARKISPLLAALCRSTGRGHSTRPAPGGSCSDAVALCGTSESSSGRGHSTSDAASASALSGASEALASVW